MNDREVVRVAGMVQEAANKLARNRYLECVQQLNLFMHKAHDLTRDSHRLAMALSHQWFAAAERCCRSISRRINEVPYAVCRVTNRLERRNQEVPTLSALAEEIRAIEQEFAEAEFNTEDRTLSAVTEAITLDGVYLGPFRIVLYLEKLGDLYHQVAYGVIAMDPHPAATDEAVTHPHVSNETVCEGDGAAAIKAALEQGRLSEFFTLVRSILTTYNPDSPYVPLADWNGVSCYECGYVMDTESSCYCTYCDNAFCDECSAVCESCAEVVCRSCAGTCEICERSLCPQCAKTKCAQCEAVCCQSCLDDGLCPECKEERDNHEETQAQDHQETTGQEEETVPVGERLADRGQCTCPAGPAVQSQCLGQAAVLPGPIRQ